MLTHQLTVGWSTAVFGGLMVLAGVAFLFSALPPGVWLMFIIGGGFVTARGVRKRGIVCA